MTHWVIIAAAVLALSARAAQADEQQIAPGTGLQSAVVVNTGTDGLCNTTATAGDIQAALVGGGQPFLGEVRCGPDKTVQSIAAGDDVQLIAVGATCKNVNTVIVDTGANGIPDTVLAGDDTYAAGMAFGVPPANKACVIAGADGLAQTAAAVGDDVLLLTVGTAEANTAVVLCGPNGVADTTANNVGAGDDVQLIAVGNACTANQVVVDSGANGIATTRAEGPDLFLKNVGRVLVNIPKGLPSKSKTIKLTVLNVEFGASAPLTRGFRLTTTGSTCPGGVVTQIDANAVTPGLQATGTVPLGGMAKASIVAKLDLEDVTTTSLRSPIRCSFDVNVIALDTDPDFDDGVSPENNTATVIVQSLDKNDL